MPCSDAGWPQESRGITDEEQMKTTLALLRLKVDTLTDLLCKAGRARQNPYEQYPPEVLKWWEDHCEIDRKRGEPW